LNLVQEFLSFNPVNTRDLIGDLIYARQINSIKLPMLAHTSSLSIIEKNYELFIIYIIYNCA